jgi:hypothetical protein
MKLQYNKLYLSFITVVDSANKEYMKITFNVNVVIMHLIILFLNNFKLIILQ